MLGQPLSMLLPRVVGIELVGALPVGVDRDRPRADRRASCCASTVWSASSSSSTARASAGCRSRTGRRSATCRPSTARRARSSRSTTRRCATCARPAGPTISSRSSRRTRRNRGSGTTPRSGPCTTRRSRARPVDGRAVARGPGAAAGSGVAVGRAVELRAGAARVPPGSRRAAPRRSARRAARPTRRRSSRSRRAIRPRRRRVTDADRTPRRRARPPGRCSSIASVPGDARRRPQLRARRRSRRDRGDHVVHEHVEPVGDDRGGPARARTRSRAGSRCRRG